MCARDRSFGLLAGALGLVSPFASSCSRSAPCAPSAVGSDASAASEDAPAALPSGSASVLQEHLHPSRDGAYVDAKLTHGAAAALHLQKGFQARYDGVAYGEPLYVEQLRPGLDALF